MCSPSSPRCSRVISRGSFTTLVDSSLNVTQYWKTTPPCTSKEPLHWPWSCRNVTVSTPPWHYTGEKGLYLHMKTLAIKYPTQPCVDLSVCLALNGPLLLLLSVICLCITHCWSQSLIDSLCLVCIVKGIVHPKMKILSSFTHPQVVPNLYECLCSAEHKGRYSEECGKQSSSGAPLTCIVFFFLLWKSMVPQKQPGYKLLQNIFLEQRNSYRFGTTWGGVNDDRIFIFGWTIPLTASDSLRRRCQ